MLIYPNTFEHKLKDLQITDLQNRESLFKMKQI